MPQEVFGCAAKGQFVVPGAKPSYAPHLLLEPVHYENHFTFDLRKKTVRNLSDF
jgi:hypothetical protein